MGLIKNIEIDDLINYSENPRHEIGVNESDTLKKLFVSVGRQFMLNLAEDIVKHGLLGNQQIVVVQNPEHEKKYIVYEGNRRVAAIKLLKNPEEFKFLDSAFIKKVRNISRGYNAPKTIPCYVTDDENARFIMERIHSGEDKGRGVKQWNAREKDIFKSRQNNTKSMAYLIDVYTRKFSKLEITQILPFTTIERIFNNREIKKVIGLDIKDEKSFTKGKIELIVAISRRVLEESKHKKIAVTRLFNRARDIEDKILPWIQEIQGNFQEYDTETNNNVVVKNDVIDVKDVKDVNKSFGEVGKSAPKTIHKNNHIEDNINIGTKDSKYIGNNDNIYGINNKLKQSKNIQSPYFFQGIKIDCLDQNNSNAHGPIYVCRELLKISNKKEVENYPLATAFLIRAMIEQALIYYSKRNTIQGQSKFIWEELKHKTDLGSKIKLFNKSLTNYILDHNIRQYWKNLFEDYERIIDPLNWVIHRPGEFQLNGREIVGIPRKGLLALVNYLLEHTNVE